MQQAALHPTSMYMLFYNAKELGKSVGELATGRGTAISNMEMFLWNVWRTAEARLQQQNRKPGKR